MSYLLFAVAFFHNSIATTEVFEENEKNVNHIFLNTIVKSIPLNGTQVSLLTDIALQCPYEGGTAVFRARAILDGLVETEFDDELACGQDGGQQLIITPGTGQEVFTSVTVYPNPVKKTVTVKFSDGIAQGQKVGILFPFGCKSHYSTSS